MKDGRRLPLRPVKGLDILIAGEAGQTKWARQPFPAVTFAAFNPQQAGILAASY